MALQGLCSLLEIHNKSPGKNDFRVSMTQAFCAYSLETHKTFTITILF